MKQQQDSQNRGEEPEVPEEPNSNPLLNLPRGNWAAMDADYGDNPRSAPDYPTRISTTGVVGSFWKVDPDPPSDIRVRIERPVLFFWLVISGVWQGFIPWVIMGLALIVYAFIARPAFRHYGWAGQPWVYVGIGLGQIMLAWTLVANLGAVWPFIALYWLVVILSWFIMELRRTRPM